MPLLQMRSVMAGRCAAGRAFGGLGCAIYGQSIRRHADFQRIRAGREARFFRPSRDLAAVG